MEDSVLHETFKSRAQLVEIVYGRYRDNLYAVLLANFAPVEVNYQSAGIFTTTSQTYHKVCYALEALAFVHLNRLKMTDCFDGLDVDTMRNMPCTWKALMDFSARLCPDVSFRDMFTRDCDSNIPRIHALFSVVLILSRRGKIPDERDLQWIKDVVMSEEDTFAPDMQWIKQAILIPFDSPFRRLQDMKFHMNEARVCLETGYRLLLMWVFLKDANNDNPSMSEAERTTMGMLLNAIGGPLRTDGWPYLYLVGGLRGCIHELASKVVREPGRNIWESHFGPDVNELMLDLERNLMRGEVIIS